MQVLLRSGHEEHPMWNLAGASTILFSDDAV